jgi:hypothetical protein
VCLGLKDWKILNLLLKTDTAEGEYVKFGEIDILHRLAELDVNKAAGVVGFHLRVLYELTNIFTLPLKL